MVGLLASIVSFSVGSPAQAFGAYPDYVVSGEDAYLLAPSATVVESRSVVQAAWSSDGRYLVGTRSIVQMSDADIRAALSGTPPSREPQRIATLFVWERSTGKATEVWRGDESRTRVIRLLWVGNSSTAAALIETAIPAAPSGQPSRVTELLVVPAGSGRALHVSVPGMYASSFVNSTQVPLLGVCCENPSPGFGGSVSRTTEWYTVRQDGSIRGPVEIPRGCNPIGLAPNGNPVVHVTLRESDPRRKQFPAPFGWIDLTSGRFAPMSEADAKRLSWPVQGTETLSLRRSGRTLGGTFQLELYSQDTSGPSAAKVCLEAQAAELAPDLGAVFYVSRGVGLVRTILKVPRKPFEEALFAAQKADCLSRAKQAALAAQMYALDFEGKLPPEGADMASLLSPYVRDQSVLDGFTYTFHGGSLKDLADPARTEIGFIRGPRGRAVAYADGHVVWVLAGD